MHALFLAGLASLAALTAASIPAQAADKVLNGGDGCERRFEEVSKDLKTWIENDGHQALVYPQGQSAARYRPAMLAAIAGAAVSCTSEPLSVGSADKICVNQRDASGHARITCQREAYLNLAADEQYRLTHHEYAGIAGFEENQGPRSLYSLSNQVTGYLDSFASKRLTVKGAEGSLEALNRRFQDFYGNYEVVSCSSSVAPAERNRESDFCQLAVISIESGKMITSPASGLYAKAIWNKTPDLKGGLVLGYSYCQLSYGTVDCQPGQGGLPPGVDPARQVYYSSRFSKIGSTTFLDVRIEDSAKKSKFESWSFVLKPYTGPMPEKK